MNIPAFFEAADYLVGGAICLVEMTQTCRPAAINHDQRVSINTGCNRRRQGNLFSSARYYPYVHPWEWHFKSSSGLRYCNTRVERSADVWTGVIGQYGVGDVNDNGRPIRLLLIGKYAERRLLLITNTTFRMKGKHKTSWMHPRSKHWRLFDYVITPTGSFWDIHEKLLQLGDKRLPNDPISWNLGFLSSFRCQKKM